MQGGPEQTQHDGAAVVLVNYGSHLLIEANLAPLHAELAARGIRIVIVDSHHSPAESAAIRRLASAHGWLLVPLPDNPGFAAAANIGIRRAVEDADPAALVLLNPDVALDVGVLSELCAHAQREPLALISPRIVSAADGWVFDGSVVRLASGRIRAVPGRRAAMPWLPGTCLAFSRALVERIGNLDERYFLYWEDVEYSHRCLAAGGAVVLRGDLLVRHAEGGTQGVQRGRAKSARYYYFNCRNRLLFAARELPRAQLARWILATPLASRDVLLRGGRRQLLTSLRPLLATVAGSLAGLRVALPALLGGRRR